MDSLIRRTAAFDSLYRGSATHHRVELRHHKPCNACKPGEWELDCQFANDYDPRHVHSDKCYRRIRCTQDISVLRTLDRALYGGVVEPVP